MGLAVLTKRVVDKKLDLIDLSTPIPTFLDSFLPSLSLSGHDKKFRLIEFDMVKRRDVANTLPIFCA
jgi:hypothetical protein|tara:strand:+ start:392 stop:592 length:201 start_codon:yes stop_codon:yes gene_type:complete